MSVRITEVTYLRRVNLGNYEHEEISASGVIAEGADVQEALTSVKNEVLAALNLGEAPKKEAVTKKPASNLPEPKTKTSKPAAKEGAKPATPKPRQAIKEESDKADTTPKKRDVSTSAKAKASKNIAYDRNNSVHKKALGDLLDKNCPGWNNKVKEERTLANPKALSEALVGQDIMDNKGKVLDSFEVAVIAQIEAQSNEL